MEVYPTKYFDKVLCDLACALMKVE